MVDRESRDKLADQLQGFLDGSVPIEEFIKSAPQDSQDYIIMHLVQSIKRLSIGDLHQKDKKVKEPLMRSVEFLRTDQEYRWISKSADWPVWKCFALAIPIALAAIVVIVTVLILLFAASFQLQSFLFHHIGVGEGPCLIATLVVFIAIFAAFQKLVNKIRGKDIRYWPFYGPKDYEAARKGN